MCADEYGSNLDNSWPVYISSGPYGRGSSGPYGRGSSGPYGRGSSDPYGRGMYYILTQQILIAPSKALSKLRSLTSNG